MLVAVSISTVNAGSIDVQKSNRTRICAGDVDGRLCCTLDRGSARSSVVSQL